MQDPKTKFDEYVDDRKITLIDDILSTGIVPQYKDGVHANLMAFRNRLDALK